MLLVSSAAYGPVPVFGKWQGLQLRSDNFKGSHSSASNNTAGLPSCPRGRDSILAQVIKEAIYDAFYKLTDSRSQITAYVFDVVRASVPRMDLDEIFVVRHAAIPSHPDHNLLTELHPTVNLTMPCGSSLLKSNTAAVSHL